MGTNHSALMSAASTDPSVESIELTQNLSQYTAEERLYPGSGRMMRTFRLRHASGSLAIVKTMWVSQEEEEENLQEQEAELRRIKEALQNQPHVAPFLFWKLGVRKVPGPRPVYLTRPYVYTTLSDRLASRPFLNHAEKLWIVYQTLQALDALHEAGVVHGFLTTENIGLTSWNWVVLLDISSYKALTALPDDDPSAFLYYYQEQNKHGTDTTPREKRCYLAPERFYTPRGSSHGPRPTDPKALTPASDMFSAGCVLIETFLNGERALDLGDLMEYRRNQSVVSSSSLQNKLNKIESSSLRAACRHMLHLDPSQRLSAREYLERLSGGGEADPPLPPIMPPTFGHLFSPLFEKVTCEVMTPDARMELAAAWYGNVLRETVGVVDTPGERYFAEALGSTMCEMEGDKEESPLKTETPMREDEDESLNKPSTEENEVFADLLAETEDLLRKVKSLALESKDDGTSSALHPSKQSGAVSRQPQYVNVIGSTAKTSPSSASSLLVYLQLVLSNIRHVQRPSSKLVALQLLKRLAKFSSDEARLQRIVPSTILLLHDQDALVRAWAMKVLTSTLSIIQTFPPSDSKVFPQYIFKRVAHLITDQSLVVRVAFAESIPLLAETALRFLDISQAVRLYEAVGGGGGGGGSRDERDSKKQSDATVAADVFADDVAKLLDSSKPESGVCTAKDAGTEVQTSKAKAPKAAPFTASVGKTLISSTYHAELAALHETISRWVMHITTDQSEQSSPPKLGLLRDLARLSHFFGRDGVMAFILPQILAFLNDRRDWELRAALFEHLPSLCYIIGRAATEHFVLPCLETALVDGEEQVMSRALLCLASLVEMGLLSRSVLIGSGAYSMPDNGRQLSESRNGLFERYAPLLLYPSASVRHSAVTLVAAACQALGFPDRDVFLVPALRPYLRFEPSAHHLTTLHGLSMCLVPPWTKKMLCDEMDRLSKQTLAPTAGRWTSIGIDTTDEDAGSAEATRTVSQGRKERNPPLSTSTTDSGSAGSRAQLPNNQASETVPNRNPNIDQVHGYLRMLSKSRRRVLDARSTKMLSERKLANAIEGSLKLAQHVKFPSQKFSPLVSTSLPSWYSDLRDFAFKESNVCSELSAIRSVSALGQVYGLSLMQSSTTIEAEEDIVNDSGNTALPSFSDDSNITDDDARAILTSNESKTIESACAGEWGSEARLDPPNVDTTLLVTKLNGLGVPPLPPRLGMSGGHGDDAVASQRHASDPRDPAKDRGFENEWRPKADALVASSSTASGHSAPVARLAVAQDQGFFVSGSHDGTCRVWELRQMEDSSGILESSLTYSGHSGEAQVYPRINDVAIVENSNSVVSGASDGAVHVWRVDVVKTKKQSPDAAGPKSAGNYETSRVTGSSVVRNIDPNEGEVLAVSHFNSPSASVITFATQKGLVHSWDLRCAREPFSLKHQPDLGYLTSMALGSDRHWILTGTSRGFLALWDIRFQNLVKLWQHSSASPVNRLATSFAALPRGHNVASTDAHPFMFAACGPNECAMFDILDGACRQCFRVLDPGTGYMDPSATSLPSITEVPLSVTERGRLPSALNYVASPLNRRITGMVGHIGGSEPRDYLITGGSDCRIRYFDFLSPSKCFTISGLGGQQRPSFERVDFEGQGRLITCHEQSPTLRLRDIESSKLPRKLHRGVMRPETKHQDAITDLKMISSPLRALLSCSNDGSIKMWR